MKSQSKPFTVKDTTTKVLSKFATVEEAWFWFIRTEKSRAEQAKAERCDTMSERPCDPDDIFNCVARLYREKLLCPLHLEVLGEYGYLDRDPYTDDDTEVVDWVVWMDAFDVLEPYLLEKEIIECPTHFK